MKKTTLSPDTLEATLRQTSPPLARADPARVARVCDRIADLSDPPVRHRPHVFAKPLIRVAAGLMLLCSIAVLLRTDRPVTPATDLPHIASVPSMNDLSAIVDTHPLTDALTCESNNLIADLTALADVLNDRSLAILF